MRKLIDTHTHIYYAGDNAALDEQMDRCAAQHVDTLLLPNVDRESIPQVLHAADRYPGRCLPMMGLHPCSVGQDFMEQLSVIEGILGERRVFGIGEIGLDLYWDTTNLEAQEKAFRIQIAWAKEARLPVSIHCREAYGQLFVLLKELQDGRLKGVLHCFTGTYEDAQRTIGLGLSLGVGGVVTFKNADLSEVIARVSLDHIVLETDAPYLAPVPFRGKPNESSYLPYIAKKVADLHETTVETIADITSRNARQLFGLDSQQ